VPSLKPSKFATGRVPGPDGAYSGGNTAEGQAALFSLTTDMNNAAVEFSPLRSNTIGSFNTAIAVGAILSSTGDQNTVTGTWSSGPERDYGKRVLGSQRQSA
jgi:hypothetical protein